MSKNNFWKRVEGKGWTSSLCLSLLYLVDDDASAGYLLFPKDGEESRRLLDGQHRRDRGDDEFVCSLIPEQVSHEDDALLHVPRAR